MSLACFPDSRRDLLIYFILLLFLSRRIKEEEKNKKETSLNRSRDMLGGKRGCQVNCWYRWYPPTNQVVG